MPAEPSRVVSVEERGSPVGGAEVWRPGPVLGEPQDDATAAANDAPGRVQEPVAQRLGFGVSELIGETAHAEPGEEVMRGEDRFQPGAVGGEAAEGHAIQAGVA